MLKRKINTIIITLFICWPLLTFFSCNMKEDGQSTRLPTGLTEQEQQLVQELNEWLFPLESPPLELTDDQLGFLDRLRDARIAALGEATHGTREFFQMKHRIFKYLVEHHQHRAFGFEADFAESIYINNYITRGEGNLDDIVENIMHFWVWKTQEVKELLEWMKNYNEGKSEEEKIHYYGFDCQFTDLHPGLIQEYLTRTMPELWGNISPSLEQVRNLSTDDIRGLSAKSYIAIKDQLESARDQVTANQNQLVSNSSLREYKNAFQLFNTLLQGFAVNFYYGKGGLNRRDRYMAENALWIANSFGEDAKITLWAHNAHVAKDPFFSNDRSMGYQLYKELDQLYQVVGFAFSTGGFSAVGQGNASGSMTHEITSEPKRQSINFLCHHASHANFAFHLDAVAAGSQWDNWLASSKLFLMIGSVYKGSPEGYYMTINIREQYDWIIYFDNTTASRLL